MVRAVVSISATITGTMSLLWQPFPMPAGRRAYAWFHHPSTRKPAHFHEEPEINLVARGRATFVVANRRVEMTAGSLLWYPPGLDHYLAEASNDLELFVVGFRRELLDAMAREHRAVPNYARPLQYLDEQTLHSSASVFTGALSSSDSVAVEKRLIEVLAVLDKAGKAPTLGFRAARLVAELPTRRRDDLARGLSSNRGDVSRRFRSDLGLPLAEYKNRLRTLQLISLIEAGYDNLTQASLQAGFGSYTRCHQVIRKTFGLTPSELADAIVRKDFIERFEPMLIG